MLRPDGPLVPVFSSAKVPEPLWIRSPKQNKKQQRKKKKKKRTIQGQPVALGPVAACEGRKGSNWFNRLRLLPAPPADQLSQPGGGGAGGQTGRQGREGVPRTAEPSPLDTRGPAVERRGEGWSGEGEGQGAGATGRTTRSGSGVQQAPPPPAAAAALLSTLTRFPPGRWVRRVCVRVPRCILTPV